MDTTRIIDRFDEYMRYKHLNDNKDRSHAVTFIYIKPDSSKVDEANRKVIDHIKKGLTSQPDPLPEK